MAQNNAEEDRQQSTRGVPPSSPRAVRQDPLRPHLRPQVRPQVRPLLPGHVTPRCLNN